MLCVKTEVRPSNISGLGLFAVEVIPKGTIVWKFHESLDKIFSKSDLLKLSEPSRDQILRYSYFDKRLNGYVLCGDDARFFNHSIYCNCNDSEANITIALTDIMPGEELTVDYRTFYADSDLVNIEWLKN